MDNKGAITVSRLNSYVKNVLFQDDFLQSVAVRGELGNLRNYRGHLYFTLKDDKASVRAVMWQSHARMLKFIPEDGMEVVVTGSLSVYERDGVYQIYAVFMEPSGLGALYAALERLKEKLEKEGFFKEERKRPLPPFPHTVGLVTSVRGAAIKDIVSVGRRRFPGVRFAVADTKVQGEGAPSSIARSIRALSSFPGIDVIIVSRGGGSQEDLFVFNDETVARAIFNCPVPVVSAVGHERDTTVADLVADARAATPSAAAEMVVPNVSVIKDNLLMKTARMQKVVLSLLNEHRQSLAHIRSRPSLQRPDYFLVSAKDALLGFDKDLSSALERILLDKRSAFERHMGKLDALSPLRVLNRGYSITRLLPGEIILKNAKDAPAGSTVKVSLLHGFLTCLVRESSLGE